MIRRARPSGGAVQTRDAIEIPALNGGSWGDTLLRSPLWLALGGWVGAWFLFAFGVSLTAFRVLPTTELAGQGVGPLPEGLNLYGAARCGPP